MNDKITAEWARKQSKEVLGERVKSELTRCENAILSAVKSNTNSCNVYIYAHSVTINELKNRGFKTTQHDDQRDGSTLVITW